MLLCGQPDRASKMQLSIVSCILYGLGKQQPPGGCTFPCTFHISHYVSSVKCQMYMVMYTLLSVANGQMVMCEHRLWLFVVNK